MVDAQEALTLGLFDRVVADGQALPEALELAATWAAHPPLAIGRVKEGMYASAGRSLRDMLDWEVAQQRELFATPEARQLVAAEAAKRR